MKTRYWYVDSSLPLVKPRSYCEISSFTICDGEVFVEIHMMISNDVAPTFVWVLGFHGSTASLAFYYSVTDGKLCNILVLSLRGNLSRIHKLVWLSIGLNPWFAQGIEFQYAVNPCTTKVCEWFGFSRGLRYKHYWTDSLLSGNERAFQGWYCSEGSTVVVSTFVAGSTFIVATVVVCFAFSNYLHLVLMATY